VDGKPLPFVEAFDSFSFRSGDGSTENLNLALQKLALQRILAAKQDVAIKVRLYSTPLGQSGECTTAMAASAKQLACTNPYTGAVFSGKALQQLQTTLKPFVTP
jgi:hypothetical protein